MDEFKKNEEEILKFWQKEKIYEKVKQNNKKGKKFYFMDGPPYATGHIHMGTALNKILKDIAMRIKRIQGFNVFDRPGYDTHGIPIEYQVEKELGFESKKDIEKYGIKKFIEKCKEYATKYIDVMNSEFKNLGVWMDWKNPYLTLEDEYIEAIWWSFKKAFERGLLYLGRYPVHVCPRCETAVAYNEIEYKKLEDQAIYVKFPLKEEKNKFLVIWTTTPWTLPGNTAVMVNPNFVYGEVELGNGERWIIAKEKIPEIMNVLGLAYRIVREYKGKEMEGWKYKNPLEKNLKVKTKNAYKVLLSSRYVNLEEGTGLVHCAPGHGKEDYEVGKKYNIDVLSPVSIDGIMTQEAGKYSKKRARIVDEEIIKDLEKMNMLIYKHKYTHDYPLCWRCKTPLLMISLSQWFFRIEKIHKKLIEENEKTKWIPDWAKLRMKAWLEGIGDWPISRKRYWGTPLPIWKCEKCQEIKVIGSKAELKKLSGCKKIDMHKPEIDKIKIKCKCGGNMRRIEEVLDVWFDSGVSSWAALEYPDNKEKFKKFWPADLNIEGADQFRGWWNSQLILSIISFDKKPFDSVLVHGMVLDLGKKKMSKSLGNVTTPSEVINKYCRDYLRYFFAKMSKGENFAFDEKEFRNIESFARVLLNVNKFINQLGKAGKAGKLKIEDKWILSRLNSTIQKVLDNYESYKFPKVTEILERFLLEEVSRTYIKLIRERSEETSVKWVLNKIMENYVLLLSPIMPFLCEKIYSDYGKKKSIFLERIGKVDEKKINKKLEEEFEEVLGIIEKGLAERDLAKIGLRWPLKKATVYTEKKINKKLEDVIKKQLNVKEVEFKKGKLKIEIDVKINAELEAEGYAREVARRIQVERKKAGLIKKDKIKLLLITSTKIKKFLIKHKKFLQERTNSKILEITDKIEKKPLKEFEIKNEKIRISFKKI